MASPLLVFTWFRPVCHGVGDECVGAIVGYVVRWGGVFRL